MGAEFLARRTFAVEAVEDRGQLVVRDAGSLILDGNQNGAAIVRAVRMRISPCGGLNDTALVMRLRNTCDSRLSIPGTMSGRLRSVSSSTRCGAPSVRVDSWMSTSASQHRRDVDRRYLETTELGVEAGRIGDVGDQPVESLDIVENDRHQPALLDGILDPHSGLDRAAQRAERVLDLVGDIGGETFDRAHPLPQRVGHLAQRAGEIADLVAAPGEIRDFDPRAAAARALCRFSEAADRPGDRAGEVEREQAR